MARDSAAGTPATPGIAAEITPNSPRAETRTDDARGAVPEPASAGLATGSAANCGKMSLLWEMPQRMSPDRTKIRYTKIAVANAKARRQRLTWPDILREALRPKGRAQMTKYVLIIPAMLLFGGAAWAHKTGQPTTCTDSNADGCTPAMQVAPAGATVAHSGSSAPRTDR